MKIIEPQVELWQQEDPISHVAKCARVCYGNAVSKGQKADQALYDNLKKSGHLSMFRHESIYAIVAATDANIRTLNNYVNCPYIQVRPDSNTNSIYITTNNNFMMDKKNDWISDVILPNKVSAEHFANTEMGHSMMRYTFHITTQISTSRELNRVSPNNIAEKSTRYVKEDGTICRPYWMSEALAAEFNEGFGIGPFSKMTHSEDIYIESCLRSFATYKELCDLQRREDARGVLPLDTATEVVYTYSIDEWKHIIKLRSDKRAHPNAQIIANMIKSELEELGYDFV